jgi:Ca2+-binding EF-hand superfamily protein
LKHIHPDITKDEIKFFFEKMDINADGSISISELSTEMEKHFINFSKFVPEHHDP